MIYRLVGVGRGREPKVRTALCSRKMNHAFAKGSAEWRQPGPGSMMADKMGRQRPLPVVQEPPNTCEVLCTVRGLDGHRPVNGHTDHVETLASRRAHSGL